MGFPHGHQVSTLDFIWPSHSDHDLAVTGWYDPVIQDSWGAPSGLHRPDLLQESVSVTNKLHLIIHLIFLQLFLNILNKDLRTAPSVSVADDHTLFFLVSCLFTKGPFLSFYVYWISSKAFDTSVRWEPLWKLYRLYQRHQSEPYPYPIFIQHTPRLR